MGCFKQQCEQRMKPNVWESSTLLHSIPLCDICADDRKAGNESLLKCAVPIMGFLSIALMRHCPQCFIHTDV